MTEIVTPHSTHRPLLNPQELLRHLRITPGMHVGDFGVGGAAFFAVPLGQMVGEQGEVLMFDVVKSALSAALSETQRRGLKNCRAVWVNLEIFEGAHGIGQQSLEAGVLTNVLHQTKKQADVLTEIHRMLKAGASLLVVDWSPGVKISFAPPPADRVSGERIAEIARGIGFAPAEKFSAGEYHWGLVLVKT